MMKPKVDLVTISLTREMSASYAIYDDVQNISTSLFFHSFEKPFI